MEIKGGDRIPADLRIISAHGCKVRQEFFQVVHRNTYSLKNSKSIDSNLANMLSRVQGPRFHPDLRLRCVLPMFTWVPAGFTSSLTLPKHMLIGKWAMIKCESECECVYA